MTLVKYRPSNDMYPAFNNLFDSFWGRDMFAPEKHFGQVPAVNIKESNDKFEVEVAAPGLKKDDFKVELDNRLLKISVARENSHEEKGTDGKYSRREFSYQSFERAFSLPDTVETDKIAARYEDGILRLDIPKREEAKVKPKKVLDIA